MSKKAIIHEVKKYEVEGLGTINYSQWTDCIIYNCDTNSCWVCIDLNLDEPLDKRFRHIWFPKDTDPSTLEHYKERARVFPWERKITTIALELYNKVGNEVMAKRTLCAERGDNSNVCFKFVVNSAIDLPEEYLAALAKQMTEWIKKDLSDA